MNALSHFARFQFTNITDWLDSLDSDTAQADEEEQFEALLGNEWAACESLEALLDEEWPAFKQLEVELAKEWPELDDVGHDTGRLAHRRGRPRRGWAQAGNGGRA